MLKIIHVGNAMPASWPVDPTAEFEAGMFAQLKVIGNDIVAGVSDGTAPLGIIDDVRTVAFTKPQIDEIVEINVTNTELDLNGDIVNTSDETGFLDNPSIIDNSFTSTVSVVLNAVNGAVIVPAGTPLNYDFDDDGIYDGYKIIVSYIFRQANKPGDDSTSSSGKVTLHYSRGFYCTDQYDSRQSYPINANIFIGLDGKITTKQVTQNHPSIGVITASPGAANATIEFLLL